MPKGSTKIKVKEPLMRPRTKREFAAMLYNLFKVVLPPVAVCKGHLAPLDVIWGIYSQQYPTAVVVAARKSGKTMSIAALQVMFSLTYNFLKSCDVAATKQQSQMCYEYSRNLLFKPQGALAHKVRDYILDEGTKSELTLATGSQIFITTGSLQGVNAIHPNKLFMDEVELIRDWQIIQEALLAPCSEGDIMRQIAFISSWKFKGGMVDRIIEKYQNDKEVLIAHWCSFEAMQPIPDCSFCHSLKRKLSDGTEVTFADFCKEEGYCKGKKARGFMSLLDVRRNFLELEEAVFRTQWLTQKPQGSGLKVFYIRNTSLLKHYTPVLFKEYPVVVGVDYGKITALVFCHLVPPGWVVVFDERILFNISPYELAQYCLAEQRKLAMQGLRVEAWAIDPRSQYILQKEFLQAGLPSVSPLYHSPNQQNEKKNRVAVANSFLVPSGDLGLPRLYFFAPKVSTLLRQMDEMSYKTTPDGIPLEEIPDGDDHCVDALLYALSYIYGLDRIVEIQTLGAERGDSQKVVSYILDQVIPEQGEDPTRGELTQTDVNILTPFEREKEVLERLTTYLNEITPQVLARVAREQGKAPTPAEAYDAVEKTKEVLSDWVRKNIDLFSKAEGEAFLRVLDDLPPEMEQKLLEISVRALDRAMMTPRFGGLHQPTDPIVALYEQVIADILLGGGGFPSF